MKILLPMDSEMQIGGGFTFYRNLKKGGQKLFEFTDCITGGGWSACLIVSSSVINRSSEDSSSDLYSIFKSVISKTEISNKYL